MPNSFPRTSAFLSRAATLFFVLLISFAVPARHAVSDATARADGVKISALRVWYPAGASEAGGPIRSLLNHRRQMRFGEYLWDEIGVPRGRLSVRVNLAHQTLSVFRGGHEIGTTVILYGTDSKPTPTGEFHILEKARKHRSTLYDAEMPYMLRLTVDGVAIHASAVRQGSATHGCIGLPEDFARRLFSHVKRGDQVIIAPLRA